MNIGDHILIRATVHNTPDSEADRPEDRFYTFQIDVGSREAGAPCDQTEIVSIYECVVRDRTVPDNGGRAEQLPIGSVVAVGDDVLVLRSAHARIGTFGGRRWRNTDGAEVSDSHINEWLRGGSARILRVGNDT